MTLVFYRGDKLRKSTVKAMVDGESVLHLDLEMREWLSHIISRPGLVNLGVDQQQQDSHQAAASIALDDHANATVHYSTNGSVIFYSFAYAVMAHMYNFHIFLSRVCVPFPFLTSPHVLQAISHLH